MAKSKFDKPLLYYSTAGGVAVSMIGVFASNFDTDAIQTYMLWFIALLIIDGKK
jgi:hypothetical protein